MPILQEPFLQKALLAAMVGGTLCAFLGVYIHLKRIVFVGIALSEVAALGVAAGLFLGVRPELAASVLTVLAAQLFWMGRFGSRVPRDAVLGLVYCLAAALAVILLSANPLAEAHGVDLVSGNLLYVSGSELLTLFVLAGVVLPVHMLLYRTLLFVSLDPETAVTQRINVRAHEFVLFLTLGVSIAVTMKIAGVLFVFGSMVIPPMTGLAVSRRVSGVFLVSVLSALLAAGGGLWVSFARDLPTGPSIVLVQTLLFFLAVLLRRGR